MSALPSRLKSLFTGSLGVAVGVTVGVGLGAVGVGVGVGVRVAVGVDVGVGVGVRVAVGVGVGVGVGVRVPCEQLPLALNTICMLGKPRSAVGVGSGTPQSAALR